MINYMMQCAGIESFIMNMYRNVEKTKVQFDFLVHYTKRQFYDDEIERMGGKIYRLSIREDNNFPKYTRDLKNFFSEHPEYKIVHGHMESFGGFYLSAAKKAGVPVRIAHSHIAQKNKGFKGTFKNVLNRSFKTFATDLFACSDAAGKFVFGNNADFTVYNNAIDTSLFAYQEEIRNNVRQELGIAPDKFVIGHVGRFNAQKNHDFLIDIFREVKIQDSSAVLLLIGEGNLENRIKSRIKAFGLEDSVRLLGIRRDVNRLYQAMDVFVMPSLFEGLPVSGIEAQTAGLKCIFSDRVTKQTALTENAGFLPLESGAGRWAHSILEYHTGYSRNDVTTTIIHAGYDIKDQANKLQDFYLERYYSLEKY